MNNLDIRTKALSIATQWYNKNYHRVTPPDISVNWVLGKMSGVWNAQVVIPSETLAIEIIGNNNSDEYQLTIYKKVAYADIIDGKSVTIRNFHEKSLKEYRNEL